MTWLHCLHRLRPESQLNVIIFPLLNSVALVAAEFLSEEVVNFDVMLVVGDMQITHLPKSQTTVF